MKLPATLLLTATLFAAIGTTANAEIGGKFSDYKQSEFFKYLITVGEYTDASRKDTLKNDNIKAVIGNREKRGLPLITFRVDQCLVEDGAIDTEYLQVSGVDANQLQKGTPYSAIFEKYCLDLTRDASTSQQILADVTDFINSRATSQARDTRTYGDIKLKMELEYTGFRMHTLAGDPIPKYQFILTATDNRPRKDGKPKPMRFSF